MAQYIEKRAELVHEKQIAAASKFELLPGDS
jgi:hypothetical protein